MELTWLDNAFWNTNDKTSVSAIAESQDKDGKVTRQVLVVNKTTPDGNENPDFVNLLEQVTVETIDANTANRAEMKAQEAAMQQQRQEEKIRAMALEQLFEAKLKAFEIDAVKNCTNRVLKSRLRKAKNQIELAAIASIIIMEEMNAEQSEEINSADSTQ